MWIWHYVTLIVVCQKKNKNRNIIRFIQQSINLLLNYLCATQMEYLYEVIGI